MSRLPRVDGKAVVAALSKVGFAVTRIKGSHGVERKGEIRPYP
jgi:predicted RNA binding protein YcfA (HicA-like mRNA interferase family)